MRPPILALRDLALGRTIRGRFGRALVLVGVVPLVALSILVVTSQRADLTAVANDSLAVQAHLQAAAVSSIVDHAAEAISVLAANPVLRDPEAEPTAIREQLQAYDLFEEVTLVHPKGFAIESTDYGFSGRWDANAAFHGALDGRPVMSQPLYYPHPERLVVEFAAPVMDGAEVVAVVVGSMNMDRVWLALDGITIGESGFFAAFDQHGNVIAHPDKSILLRKMEGEPVPIEDGEPGDVRLGLSDGTILVGRTAVAPSSGWPVTAFQPESETYARANDAMSEAALAAAIVVLIAAISAFVASRPISGPVLKVGGAMRRVAAGEFEQRVQRPGLDEIDSLADSFNAMASQLSKRSEELRAEARERARVEERITYQATHDALTGLPNRVLLKDRLDTALAAARRSREALAVMFLDLDRFKLVNDSMGHSCGDELLLGVSDRITAVLRDGDSVARVGGDEYVLLLPQVDGPESAVEAAERVMHTLRQPWQLHGREFRISASVGIAMYPKDGTDAEALLRNADTAMYHAKEAGRDGIALFSFEMDESIQTRVALEDDLRRALRQGQFELHYQPQVGVDSGQVIGLEALLRWRSPERGLIPPNDFIPLAEEAGLIWDIGRWVLETACAQLQSWRAAGLVDRIPVAVNVSARQFHDVAIIDVVRDILDSTGLPPDQLELEITESTAMRDVDHSVRTLSHLREMGVRISIDDFGTGYSSLSYLKRFPVNSVKIDRSFVMDLAEDAEDAAIVSAIIALAQSLSMNTVAEGVETDEQLAFLRERHCSSFQGFIFSRAVPADELVQLLHRPAASQLQTRSRTLAALGPQPAVSH